MPLTPLLGQLRRFVLERHTDATGVSGTGVVAAGVQLIGGTCVFLWVDTPAASLVVFASAQAILQVHGHNGATTLRWLDEAPDA